MSHFTPNLIIFSIFFTFTIVQEENERMVKVAESKQKKVEMELKRAEDNLKASDNLYNSLITKLEAEVKRLQTKAEVKRLQN